ncbi:MULTISPECIES: universal stress protein [Streptosporangium]|uniref:Nucleotide-binding universal stress UspA family protein n=1 Tax=Streptosporangium brasiliense TaxID=47480 RepID=A0ABT9R0F4_9ACTN|nr:universal stress protein [Streptosporangium brasiliense]MDP9862401.1 nucleotide-binding universal stress UspA family protein [Streptosporangium brasiliense]
MTDTRDVVVGYDGSDFSMQALEWAMDEAELRKLPLAVTHTWRWPYGEADDEAKLHLRKAAEHVLYHGADCARARSTITSVTADLHEGAAGDRLVELSARAELVVVGSRGMGTLARTVLGSVAGYVAAHASCPVVVVRGPGPIPVSRHHGAVVLGMAGDTADEVIEFAFHEADIRRLDLVAVQARRLQPAAWSAPMPLVPDTEAVARGAEDDLTRRLEPWQGRYPAVPVQARSVAEPAKSLLPDLSRQASLMVVGGARGHGKVGPVARSLLQRGMCPVAVVPAPPQAH